MSSVKPHHQVLNPFSKEIQGLSLNKNNLFCPDLRLNKNGFRCDDFTENHKGYHVLFAGCSITFGSGLLEEEIWSKKLFDKIKETKDVSGYYNISMPGISIFEIVASIFKYVEKFKNPDAIFVLLPNIQRRYFSKTIDPKKISPIYHSVYEDGMFDEFTDIIMLHSFHYLMFLEMYCKNNNIKLYVCSVYSSFPPMELERLFVIKSLQENKYKNIKDYMAKNIDDKYSIFARDGIHYGTVFHKYWCDIIYDLYTEELV